MMLTVPTPVDRYRWVAHYADAPSLSEDGQAVRHAAGDPVSINWPAIVAMDLVPLDPDSPFVHLDVPPGARAIHFRRRTITIDSLTGQQVPGMSEAIGWQLTVRGRNVMSLTVIRPDGSLLVTSSDEGW